MNIVLIGYRGSGKSSIGKCLATRLVMDFVDTDILLVQHAGKTIRDIFQAEGESGFRRRESEVIKDVAAQDNQVIALGGGAILQPENIAAIREHHPTRIIWLQASPEVLYQRITADTATTETRPNLTAAGGLEEVRKLLGTRTPLYQAAADVTYDVTHVAVEDAAAHLATLLGSQVKGTFE